MFFQKFQKTLTSNLEICKMLGILKTSNVQFLSCKYFSKISLTAKPGDFWGDHNLFLGRSYMKSWDSQKLEIIFVCKNMLVEAIGYYGMGSEIGNGACKCHYQYGPPKRLIPKNVSPLVFTVKFGAHIPRAWLGLFWDFFEKYRKPISRSKISLWYHSESKEHNRSIFPSYSYEGWISKSEKKIMHILLAFSSSFSS